MLQDQIKRVESNHLVEMQREKTLIERLQKSEKESSIRKTLGRVKEIIWNNIINGMNEILPNIQIIFEQKELVEKAREGISATNEEVGDMPTTTNRIIKILNSRNRYDLEELGVADRTKNILHVKKVLTKKNLSLQLEEKCQNLELTLNRFFNRIEPLNQKRLPSLFVINDKLMAREHYIKKLQGIAMDATNLSNIKGSITGKALLEAINNQIYIEHEVKHVFVVKPTFQKYSEADEIHRSLIKIKVPDEEAWSDLCDYQEERDKDD